LPELANALQKYKKHPPYSPNLAPLDFFLINKAKMGAGRPEPGPGQHQERLGGVARLLIAIDFATAFRSLLEHCKKCVHLGGEFVKKS
jgi:hypothetical protein